MRGKKVEKINDNIDRKEYSDLNIKKEPLFYFYLFPFSKMHRKKVCYIDCPISASWIIRYIREREGKIAINLTFRIKEKISYIF